MMQLTVQNAGCLAVLNLRGELKQEQADKLTSYLQRSLERVGRIIVNCEKVTGMDTACLQVLCAAYRFSRVLHKEFTLAGHRPERYRRAMQASGYEQCAGCGLDCGDGCIWGMR